MQNLSANRMLAKLFNQDFSHLLSLMEEVELNFGETLFDVDEKLDYVYFPLKGVVSLFAVEDEATLEIALVGNEGIAGLPVFLETECSPYRAVVQGSGSAMRMKSVDFIQECRQNSTLTYLLRSYTNFLFMQISQAVVCNRLHKIEARLACLLLMMHDRMLTEQFQLKQEFLSKVLGVRREAITRAAVNLQNQKLIAYSRGNLSILDRSGLEAVCCRCYEKVTKQYLTWLNQS